jgi:phospholipid/cholesterol/gamma-HCH transport system substrate-binding protein
MMFSTPAKVGILTLAALIALGSIIIWKTELFMVKEGYELIGSFQSIEGLTLGSEVRSRGFKVGKVLKIDPGPHDIKVYSVIDKDIKFPSDSTLRISYDGIVGLKFLEVRPGTSEIVYRSPQMVYGVRTSGIVDFVDIGSQNLQETKRIMENIRMMIEDPAMREAVRRTVFTADKTATELKSLTMELRQTNQGIRDIVADPGFQENIKGTLSETKKTLTSANEFFDAASNINLRASAGLDVGSRANAVRGNIDIVQKEGNYFRLGMGEGPTRQPGLLDVLFTAKANERFGYRLGVISNQLGGGLAFYPSKAVTFRGDIYDINNPRPNWPKVRLGYEYEMREYMDMILKADDILNEGNRNISVGIQVKPPGERIY